VASRFRAPTSDLTIEQALIGAIARQYFLETAGSDSTEPWFREGVMMYAGARAIDRLLDGRLFATQRFVGGFVPYTVRSLAVSRRLADARPSVVQFAALNASPSAAWRAWPLSGDDRVDRTVRALYTLERYLGWPAWQQVLEAFARRPRGTPATRQTMAAIAAEQRGRDLAWFFAEGFEPSSTFDYGIASVSSAPIPGQSGAVETAVRLHRYGNAIFAGTARSASGSLDRAPSLPVTVTFDDGNEVTDWWDGREAQLELRYVSEARASRAVVDSGVMLVLDANRGNNAWTRAPALTRLHVRLVVNWMIWLQDLALTCTAFI
jgi:hypothetical protein